MENTISCSSGKCGIKKENRLYSMVSFWFKRLSDKQRAELMKNFDYNTGKKINIK